MVFGYFHLLSPLYFTTVLANLNVRRYLHVTGDISLSGSGTNMNSEMQFAPVRRYGLETEYVSTDPLLDLI